MALRSICFICGSPPPLIPEIATSDLPPMSKSLDLEIKCLNFILHELWDMKWVTKIILCLRFPVKAEVVLIAPLSGDHLKIGLGQV